MSANGSLMTLKLLFLLLQLKSLSHMAKSKAFNTVSIVSVCLCERERDRWQRIRDKSHSLILQKHCTARPSKAIGPHLNCTQHQCR